MNLYQRMLDAAAGHGASPAFELEGGHVVTHGAFHERVDRLASGLAELGVVPDDRVMAQVDKSVDAVALYLATLRLGAVYVPLNTAYTGAELGYFMEDAEPRVFVAAPAREDAARAASSGTTVVTLGADGVGSLLQGTSDAAATSVVERAPDDLAAILYTSGTTGRSKGAMLTHGNLAANADTLRSLWGWRADDVLLHVLPVYHVHGLFVALHCALLEPSPVLFLTRFDVDAVLAALPRTRVLMGVPTHYVRLLGDPRFDARATEGVRLFISGSAPLRPETFAAFEARTGQRILERYGMTEAGMITSNPLDGPRVAGTVGPALPDVDLRIVDDEGRPVADGEVGTVQIRGPNVFAGYWRKPEKTREEFVDGWFVTGDLATRDATGRVSIVGRGKDLVISGGLNVYPREVEAELDTLAGVGESAVIGVPHADFGEGLVAVVVPQDGATPEEAELREALRSRLAGFKIPRRILLVPELPRNAMGKVQKNVLRDRFAHLFDDA